ncbi:hypothetical protein NC652_014961 [Populus alba x Populus x berolinensis]|nr:hypothetical protein NC652_014961 [Populus alba x Populus x berolinensis]
MVLTFYGTESTNLLRDENVGKDPVYLQIFEVCIPSSFFSVLSLYSI